MRKKMLFLALALTALASIPVKTAEAAACRFCTTRSDGSVCCRSCTCNSAGIPIACTNVVCSPA